MCEKSRSLPGINHQGLPAARSETTEPRQPGHVFLTFLFTKACCDKKITHFKKNYKKTPSYIASIRKYAKIEVGNKKNFSSMKNVSYASPFLVPNRWAFDFCGWVGTVTDVMTGLTHHVFMFSS